MARPTSIGGWSRAAARRWGERSTLSDSAGSIYALLIGLCAVRAAATVYFVLFIATDAAFRSAAILLQIGVTGASFSVLTGLQAARYASRIDGEALFTETPLFVAFRRALARRFLFERPFALGAAALALSLCAIAAAVSPNPWSAAAVCLAAASASAATTFAIYRFAPRATVRKHGFTAELAAAVLTVLANPETRLRDGEISAFLFNAPVTVIEIAGANVTSLPIYAYAACAVLAFFLVSNLADRRAERTRRRRKAPLPVWAMPIRRAGIGYWTAVWSLEYLFYAFRGRKADDLLLAATALAFAGGILRATSFFASAGQKLGEDGPGTIRVKDWTRSALLIALPHLLPCAILPFME